MPSNLVRTKVDEKLWSEAKSKAKDQGQSENYAYITSIYINMKKHKKTAYEVIRNIVAKTLSKEEKDKLLESLANLEHKQWISWSKSLIEFVPAEKAKRWESYQVPYDDLKEDVKELDRPFARKTMKVLEDYDLI